MSYQPKMRFLIIIFTLVTLVSCKKEDKDPPMIELLEPVVSTFSFQDYIPIKVKVTDNAKIASVSVSVRNMDNNEVLQSLIFTSSKNSEIFEGEIYINDIHLESGAYYIQAIASDGEQENAAIKEITIYGAPRVLTARVGLKSTGTQTSIFEYIDQDWLLKYNLPVNAFYSTFDSYFQNLVVAGNPDQGIMAFEPQAGSLIGQSFVPTSFTSAWQDAIFDNETKWWWLACKDGSIRAFNSTAQTRFQFNVFNNFIPNKITISDEHIIVSASNVAQTMHRIDTYLKTTGQLIHSTSVAEKIDFLYALSDNDVWIYQGSSSMQMKVYKITENYIDEWSLFRFAEEGQLIKFVPASNRLLMLFNDELRVYGFNGALTASTAVDGINLAYEKLEGNVYVNVSAQWNVYDISSLTSIGSIPDSQGIDELLFFYNK